MDNLVKIESLNDTVRESQASLDLEMSGDKFLQEWPTNILSPREDEAYNC